MERRPPFGKRLEGALEPFKPWIMEEKGYKGGQKQTILAGCTELLHA